MELKTYYPIGQTFVFERIEFEVLHYIQYDFIRQRLGLSEDQTSMFKDFVTKTLINRKNVLKYVFLASGK